MNTLLLLLLDSRAPAGAHSHSGGMEAAAATGLGTGLADLEDVCRARLATSGRVAGAFAAAACRLNDQYPERLLTDLAAEEPACAQEQPRHVTEPPVSRFGRAAEQHAGEVTANAHAAAAEQHATHHPVPPHDGAAPEPASSGSKDYPWHSDV